MNIKKHFVITTISIFIIGFSFSAYSQKSKGISKKAIVQYEEGKEHLNWDRFKEAELKFLEAIEIEPEYPEALQGLGFIYVNTRRYTEAFAVLKKLVETGSTVSSEIYFELAKLCLATKNPEEADDFLDSYVAKAKISSARSEELKQLRANLSFAKEHLDDRRSELNFELVPVGPGVNTDAREYFPTLTADGNRLYFSRMVKTGRFDNEDIFYSEWSGKEWKEGVSIGENINTYANEAAPAISPDGRTLYFTICESEYGYGGCDIWFSRKVGNEWMKPENIGKPINTTAKETQPCISSDGRSLYFVSSRKGGYGRLDIWVSHMDEQGNWGEPKNLGPNVNTIFDEQRPFIHPDNQTLYFSSDGHPGFGNDDIFVCRKDDKGNWGAPVNLGPQINTYENEEGLYVSLYDSKGFFATDRVPTDDPYMRNYDIYYFVLPPELAPKEVTYVKGRVTDADTEQFIAAEINFIDLETGDLINRSWSDEKNGEFLLCLPVGRQYAMNIGKENYLFYSQHFSLKKILPGQTYSLDASLHAIEADERVALRNIFFETNSATLNIMSIIELNILVKFLNKNPAVKIELQGHTDNTGPESFNVQLSRNRAKSVYDFLVEQGIPKSRLIYDGFGSGQPVATNDTEEGRALNRRTEFRVVEFKRD